VVNDKADTGQGRFNLAASRPSIGQIRNAQRAEVSRFNDPRVTLPNPTAQAPFDRTEPQAYESKVQALGLAPNVPKHFWQLLKGDSGAGSSIFRRVSLFQLLAPPGERVASTPFIKPIQIATMRSTDQRPRYFHVSLFSVGRIFEAGFPITPAPNDQITQFAPGIPQSVVPAVGNVARGVPLVSATKFRIMIADESGQRFFDVDVVGTRSINVYAFGVTVFALIKDEGYEIDRQSDDNPAFDGMVDQSIIGARIIPIRSNQTQNPNNRTVTISHPGGIVQSVALVPIPPGARTAQIRCLDGPAAFDAYTVSFIDADPLSAGTSGALGGEGIINRETVKATSSSTIYRIPNSNLISFVNVMGAPPTLWSVVFEETP